MESHMEGFFLWSVLSLPRGHRGSTSWTNPLLLQLRGHKEVLLRRWLWWWWWGGVAALQGLGATLLWCLCEDRVSLVCWRGGHRRTWASRMVNKWNSCTVPWAATHICQVRTNAHFVFQTLSPLPPTHTHTVIPWFVYLTSSSLYRDLGDSRPRM